MHPRMKQIAFLLFTVVTAHAQTAGPVDAPIDPKAVSLSRSGVDLPTQRVGPDDLLSVSVADCPELTRNFRVLGDGSLALPLLKERIPANNKLPGDIEVEISDALVKEQLLVRPVVSVSVAEYRSLPVSVLGAVRRPITFQAAGQVTLLDAITRADGLSDGSRTRNSGFAARCFPVWHRWLTRRRAHSANLSEAIDR